MVFLGESFLAPASYLLAVTKSERVLSVQILGLNNFCHQTLHPIPKRTCPRSTLMLKPLLILNPLAADISNVPLTRLELKLEQIRQLQQEINNVR